MINVVIILKHHRIVDELRCFYMELVDDNCEILETGIYNLETLVAITNSTANILYIVHNQYQRKRTN